MLKHLLLTIIIGFGLSGCAGSGSKSSSVAAEKNLEEKLPAEAISYFARVHRDGKPTTFKLETYLLADQIGFSGRGYLGKGALKGWLNNDSLMVYFPSSQEYLSEPVGEVLVDPRCGVDLNELDILQLFTTLPDSLETTLQLETELTSENDDELQYHLTLAGCSWQADLTYQKTDSGWRIWYLEFDNGSGSRLRLKKDQYKENAQVPRQRFVPVIPPEAVRIIP